MNRRSILKTLGLVAIGGGSYHAYSTGIIPHSIPSSFNGVDARQLTTENEIGRRGFVKIVPKSTVCLESRPAV